MNKIEPKTLHQTFKSLFESKKWADIIFVVHGKEIKAHKLVVASRSSVFEAMIESDLAPKDGKHLIDDPEITFDDFSNFLEFLYTDNCGITKENVDKLIHLGNFYNVELLIGKCVEYIENQFPSTDMLKYADLGLFYGDSCPLLDMCILKLPKLMTRGTIQSLKYAAADIGDDKWISPELALKIVEKCQRKENLTEEILFKKIFEWATKGQSDIKTEEIKAVLNPFIPFIKFEDLNAITLATLVQDNNLLDPFTLANAFNKAVKSGELKKKRQRELKERLSYCCCTPSGMKCYSCYQNSYHYSARSRSRSPY